MVSGLNHLIELILYETVRQIIVRYIGIQYTLYIYEHINDQYLDNFVCYKIVNDSSKSTLWKETIKKIFNTIENLQNAF